MARRLPSHHANIRKRIIRRPKTFWRDGGLLHALLGVGDEDALLGRPWVGASWEGFVVEQVLAALERAGRWFDACYPRTSDQRGIDLLIRTGGELWAIEIKLAANPGLGQLARLDANAEMVGADWCFLICRRPGIVESGRRAVCDLDGILGVVGGRAGPAPRPAAKGEA